MAVGDGELKFYKNDDQQSMEQFAHSAVQYCRRSDQPVVGQRFELVADFFIHVQIRFAVRSRSAQPFAQGWFGGLYFHPEQPCAAFGSQVPKRRTEIFLKKSAVYHYRLIAQQSLAGAPEECPIHFCFVFRRVMPHQFHLATQRIAVEVGGSAERGEGTGDGCFAGAGQSGDEDERGAKHTN